MNPLDATYFEKLLPDCLKTLNPYVPGKTSEALRQELGLPHIIKLGSNENPRGCSPSVQNALARLSSQQISSYLVQNNLVISQKIARQLQVEDDMITLSNGTDPLFPLFMTCFALQQKKTLITHRYAFQTYRVQAETYNIPLIETPLLTNWNIDVEAIIKACDEQTALIIFANPNNPTGGFIPEKKIRTLLENVPKKIMVVIDEAYCDYLSQEDKPNTMQLLKDFPNLAVTRTFSKAYGLAGLRLGYAVSHPTIANILKKVMQPFTINASALAAAEAAFDSQDFIQETYHLNQLERNILLPKLKKLGLKILPCYGNFITLNLERDTLPIYQSLLQQGIIVRPLHAYQMPNHLRITIGTSEQNQLWLEALGKILKTT